MDGTVLLADDDRDARRGMAKLLQSLGFQVLEADNGTLALARLRNEASRFRAAVLDVVMEGTPVGDIVAGIREIRPGFPVLLVSGFDTRRYVDAILALGSVRFLRKPVLREELMAALQDLFALAPAGPLPGVPQGAGVVTARRAPG
jgi:DNA-binding NtrC family response regulator